MATLMEYETIAKDKVLSLQKNIVVENLNIQELINLILSPDSEFVVLSSRQELISRGKDNVELRIAIKKTCKNVINELEILLKRINCETNINKNTTKSYKDKFLNTISLLDRLQLEWQKHDLLLKH